MSAPRIRLVFATGNAHKAGELGAMVADHLDLETLADHASLVMPEETGSTFEANAILKAEHVAEALGVPAIADDSGLEVDALNGDPGVRSARYAPGSDADRVTKLLGALAALPPGADRAARFVCAMALAIPGRATHVVRGVVEGRIGIEPRGEHGFGYDPVFVVAPQELVILGLDVLPGEVERTMAELPGDAKNRISHRARALASLWPTLATHFSLVVPNKKP